MRDASVRSSLEEIVLRSDCALSPLSFRFPTRCVLLFRLHERLVRSDDAQKRTPSSKWRAGKGAKKAAKKRTRDNSGGAGGSARSGLTESLLADEEAGAAGGGRDRDY